jgi:predicted Zn-dependent protease
MRVRGIDPAGMLHLMQLLEKASGSREPVSFLNTHPVFKDRIENIRRQIEKEDWKASDLSEIEELFAEIKK